LAAPCAEAQRVYALVVGADAYEHLPKLKGSVNDAELLSGALRAAGAAQVVTLENQAVTRAAIFTAFHDLAAKASRDHGWLVFTFAGHGGREPGRAKGDRLHDVILLPGFDDPAPANGERILDDDIRALLMSAPRDVKILFVADACHSGTLTRTLDPRATLASYRVATYGPIDDDVLPAPTPSAEAADVAQLPNVLFVAAALDSEVTPEMPFEGKMHGAVSWFLAKAIGGAADADGDGRTTFAELQQYIGLAARQAVESRQTPSVNFLPGREVEALPFVHPSQGPAAAGPPAPPRLGVFILNGAADLHDTPGAFQVQDRAAADLIWDVGRGEVVNNRQGDLVAQAPQGSGGPSDLAWFSGVVEKWRALAAIQKAFGGSPLALNLAPRGQGAAYGEGEAVTLSVPLGPNDNLRFLTLVDLASDGTVQWLYPTTAAEAAILTPDTAPRFPTVVRAPFGADHVIALATREAPDALRQALKALDGRKAARQLYDVIALNVKPGAYALGVAGLYTRSVPQ
jgi:hypothetical protein